LEHIEQDFSYKCKDDSLAAYMRDQTSRPTDINIFVGSSYATHEMVKWVSRASRGRPFKLFQLGILPANS
jgi:hypothetical protein